MFFFFCSQAIEFFFFAAAIGVVTLIFFCDNILLCVELNSQVTIQQSNKESKALIASHGKGSHGSKILKCLGND